MTVYWTIIAHEQITEYRKRQEGGIDNTLLYVT